MFVIVKTSKDWQIWYDNNIMQIKDPFFGLMLSLCQGVPCSLLLLQFPILLPAPFNFLPFAPFLLFPCSFFISLCSLPLFNFSSCSMLLFFKFSTTPCSFLPSWVLLAPGLHLSAPCSFIYSLACSLLLCVKQGMLPAPGLPLMGFNR